MAEGVSWGLILSAIKAGKTVFDQNQRKSLATKFKLLIRSNRKIAVFGISGAGKSQFINSLGRTLDIPERTGTVEKIRYDLNDFPITFFDTPGHSERQIDRRKVTNSIIKSPFEGIINVVSYGYEETKDADRKDVFDNNGNIKESFLQTNRKLEIDRIDEWLPLIDNTSIKWVINLVNKADLWWSEIEIVNAYYEKGTYRQRIKEINNTANVICLPYCSLIKPYFGDKTSGKFGDIDKQELYDNFIHNLSNLLKGD